MIVHALSPAAEDFYVHRGFTRLTVETPAIALDLVKLQKLGDPPWGRGAYPRRGSLPVILRRP